jgi:hypothetical protein
MLAVLLTYTPVLAMSRVTQELPPEALETKARLYEVSKLKLVTTGGITVWLYEINALLPFAATSMGVL